HPYRFGGTPRGLGRIRPMTPGRSRGYDTTPAHAAPPGTPSEGAAGRLTLAAYQPGRAGSSGAGGPTGRPGRRGGETCRVACGGDTGEALGQTGEGRQRGELSGDPGR